MTERKIDFMKTDLFHIGKFVIHGYGLMIGIGFVLALLVGEYRAKKMGMKEEALIDIAIIEVREDRDFLEQSCCI